MAKSFLLAFIGGSGLYQIEDLKNKKWINVKTPWGPPSDRILSGNVNNNKVLFLPRHGRSHIYNPSEINYRANIYALKKLGATDIISLSACGSLKENLSPGTFVLVDQFIDKTITRKKTFFEDKNGEQNTFIVQDPNGYYIEFKTFRRKEKMFI